MCQTKTNGFLFNTRVARSAPSCLFDIQAKTVNMAMAF